MSFVRRPVGGGSPQKRDGDPVGMTMSVRKGDQMRKGTKRNDEDTHERTHRMAGKTVVITGATNGIGR